MTRITMMQSRAAATTPVQSPASSDAEDETLPSRGTTPDPSMQPCDPSEALDQLNVELGRLREVKSDCTMYKAHCSLMQPQLFDDAHKRAFLSAENYVVKAAASRMVAYWEYRAELFGEQRMFLPMDKSGSLKQEDAVALERGMIQLLPQKDVDGHAVIFYDPSRHDPKLGYSSDSMLRVLWYIMHVAMEDPITRENGFVVIVYPKHSTPEQIDRDFIAKGMTIIGSIAPLAWKGFHICHPCSSYNKYFPLVKMLSPTRIKDNIAVHFGTDEHVLQCMAGYALPADRLPTELGGRDKLDYPKWISDRKEAEGEHALRVLSPQPAGAEPESADDLVMEDSLKAAQGSAKGGLVVPASSRSSTTSPRSSTTPPPASAPSEGTAKPSAAGKKPTAKNKRPGRKGDTRMHRAVTLKMDNNDVSLVEALQEGGFNFEGLNEKGRPHHEVFDQDGVSLMQRKNQLLRRIRVEKKKLADEAEEKGGK
ncbi:hypothetical protein ACHAXR_006871 [Thalassiosira sp. AJA248-18]